LGSPSAQFYKVNDLREAWQAVSKNFVGDKHGNSPVKDGASDATTTLYVIAFLALFCSHLDVFFKAITRRSQTLYSVRHRHIRQFR